MEQEIKESVDKKPCPFCGNDYEEEFAVEKDRRVVTEETVYDNYYVLCSCGARGKDSRSREQAIENWNDRSIERDIKNWTARVYDIVRRKCSNDMAGYCEATGGKCYAEKCPTIKQINSLV